MDRWLVSFVVAAAATIQSRCVIGFQSETIANPVGGVRAWLPLSIFALFNVVKVLLVPDTFYGVAGQTQSRISGMS